MRTGIFGGTFNPVHSGHVLLAQTYIAALSLERMLVIPTRIPPHKTGESLIPGENRLEMCRLAFMQNPVCEVSDIELRRPDKSYTVDTLEKLHRDFPNDEFYLIMGSDMFLTFTEWRRWQRISELAVVCVGAREKNLRPALEGQSRLLCGYGVRCRIIDLDPIPISSTEVRAMAKRGEPLDAVVPPAVAGYIAENRLYQG